MKLLSKICVLMAITVLMLSVCGCNQKKVSSESTRTSLKPQLKLAHQISLGNVAPDNIPDVTKERWSFGVPYTKPVLAPDGKSVLVVEQSKMTMYDTATGRKTWEKPTYGGIDNYVVSGDRIYLSEKYGNKRDKEHGYLICLDRKSGDELWRYDVNKDLLPLVQKYKPADAQISICCYIKFSVYDNNVFVDGYTTWTAGKSNDRVEVLLCLGEDGKCNWKVESHGYPGIYSLSKMQIINGKLVMGTHSYGDNVNGPAYVHAYDIKTGKELWKFYVEHDDELAYKETTSVNAGVVGDKVVAVANFGKVYVLDENGKKINEFVAFKPVKYNEYTICTNVWESSVDFGKNVLILAPQKTNVKGVTQYYAKAPVEHPDAGSVMVYDLNGNLQWKFRLGGNVTNMLVRGKYLLLGTSHNQDSLDYSYCGVYAFDLSQKGEGSELKATEQSVLEKYVDYYQTDGAILEDSMGVSDDGKVICANTWPTRVGAEKHGQHVLYILKME